MSPPHFPIGPSELGEGWSFSSLEERRYQFEGFDMAVREIPHKGGRTFGFRISDRSGAIAYLSDHFPLAAGEGPAGLGAYHDAALELADGVDLLLHDAQFVGAEFPAVAYLGHAAVEYAYGLTVAAGARALALFHHAPDRDDTAIDRIVEGFADAEVPVSAAAEGSELRIGDAAPHAPDEPVRWVDRVR